MTLREKKYKLVDFQPRGDHRGMLVVAEAYKEVPFEIKRIFYMYGTGPDVVRGKHSNRHSQFMMICLQGSVDIHIDDGTHKETLTLSGPNHGLYMDANVWKEMFNFSPDALLLVLASTLYDPTEYIYERP